MNPTLVAFFTTWFAAHPPTLALVLSCFQGFILFLLALMWLDVLRGLWAGRKQVQR